MRMLVVVGFCLLVSASSMVLESYHDAVGIPLADKIKAIEDASSSSATTTAGNKIVGGAVAPVNAHPYLAGLVVYLTNTANLSACGASLLSANRLVTAAHCWFDGTRQAWMFEVVLGSQMLFQGGTRINTNSVVMHPQWTPSLLWNDVAMIYLPTSVAFSSAIQPIALPAANDLSQTFVGQWAVAAGYGTTTDAQLGVSIATVVSQVNVQVITVADCARVYNQVSPYVQSFTLCTSGVGGVGICGGDSGGPLVIHRNGVPTLVGVSSFAANNACQQSYPSGFARVTSFYSFIMQHLW